MSILVLNIDEARARWKALAPGILAALSRHGPPSWSLLRDLYAAVHNGNARILIGESGFAVVFIDTEGEGRRVCNILAYTGTLREIKLLKKEFMSMAQKVGCKTVRLTGDPAWMRVVPELRLRSVIMELDIPETSED